MSGRLAVVKRGDISFWAGLFAVALTVLIPPGAIAAPADSNRQAASQVVRVRIHDIAFVPQTVTVSPGSTIEWTNDDDMGHTVTSGVARDDGAWTSSLLIPPGGTFTLRPGKPGTYRYFCKPHVYSAAMHGTIVVSESAVSNDFPSRSTRRRVLSSRPHTPVGAGESKTRREVETVRRLRDARPARAAKVKMRHRMEAHLNRWSRPAAAPTDARPLTRAS